MAERSNLSLATMFMIAASALVALTSLFAKIAGNGPDALHPMQVSAGRFAFGLMGILAFAAWRWPSFTGMRMPVHAARATCGWLGVSCVFAAAIHMPLADATAISFVSPLVTMLLAVLFLKERVPHHRWYAALVALLGVLILVRPGMESFRPAAFLAVAAACFMGLESIFIKILSDTEPPIRILLVNNSIGAAISLTAAFLVWQWPTGTQWALLICLGLVMVTAQSLFIQAMKRADANKVIPVFYASLLFATAYDFALFSVIPDNIAILGAALIVAGVGWISIRQS